MSRFGLAIGLVSVAVIVIGLVLFNSKTFKETSLNNYDHHQGAAVSEADFNSLTGKTAPAFSLENFEGKKVALSDLKGKNVLLFFSEGLMCYPACWNQMAAFGKDKEFEGKNTVVLNILVDPRSDWQRAVEKMPELGDAQVLFDTNAKVSKEYGVLSLPSSMHRGQLPGHTYVLVDKEGIIRFTKDDYQMAVRNQELLSEVDKLKTD